MPKETNARKPNTGFRNATTEQAMTMAIKRKSLTVV
jgi:hypothetical protein